MALAVLVATLVVLGWATRNDGRQYARFVALTDTRDRQRVYLRWLGAAFLLFLVLPLAGLALVGRLDAVARFPGEFARLSPAWFADGEDAAVFGAVLIGAMLAGSLAGGVLAARRRNPLRTIGNVEPMLPRNGAETWRAALLGVHAGLSEELCFRVYLPLLLVLSGVGALAAFVLAGLLFGFLHRYQGLLGLVVTTLLGLAFALVYLASGSLWLAAAMHATINLNGLAIRPSLVRWLGRAEVRG